MLAATEGQGVGALGCGVLPIFLLEVLYNVGHAQAVGVAHELVCLVAVVSWTVGSLWSENGLIFASETGEPINRHNLTRRSFMPLLKRVGLSEVRFHDLRHTCATLLLTRNVNPKIVSEMLGHSSIAITLDTYSHVLPNMRDAAAAAMEEAPS